MSGAAISASPDSIGKRQLMPGSPACRASLGRWKEAVDLDQFSPIPTCLVNEHFHEGSPARIGNGLAVELGSKQALNRQILDTDRLVLTDQSSAEFVKEIIPRRLDGTMGSANLQLRLYPVFGVFLLLCQSALKQCQSLLLLREVAGIRDLLSGRKNGEIFEAEVNADGVSAGNGINFGLDTAGDKPAAIRLPGDRHRRWVGRKIAGPNHIKRFRHLGKSDLAIAKFESGFREFRGLFSMLRSEARIAGCFTKKVAIRGIEMAKALLQWNAGYLIKPGEFCLLLHGRQHRIGLLETNGLLAQSPRGLPEFSGAIVNKPDAAERSVKDVFLLSARIESKPICCVYSGHGYLYRGERKVYKTLCQFLHALNDGVSLEKYG